VYTIISIPPCARSARWHGIFYSPPASSVARAPVRQLVPPTKMHSFRTHCPHYTPCHCPHPSTHFPDNHSSDSHVAANARLPIYCGCTTRTAALNVCPSTHDTQLRDDVCLRGGEAIGHRVHAPPQVAPSALSPLHVDPFPGDHDSFSTLQLRRGRSDPSLQGAAVPLRADTGGW
jgi:hypothetical protein